VAKKEKIETEEVEETLPDDVVDVLPALVDPLVEPGLPVAGVVGPVGPGKRNIGPKEPIPFKWKILANSGRYVLTLFKSVEREDADAQLERLQKDSYYTDLRVVDINEKIEQPVNKESRKAAAKAEKIEAAKIEAAKVEAAKKLAKAAEKATKPGKPPVVPAKGPTVKKAVAKTVEKPSRPKPKAIAKKPSSSRTTAKVTSKKR